MFNLNQPSNLFEKVSTLNYCTFSQENNNNNNISCQSNSTAVEIKFEEESNNVYDQDLQSQTLKSINSSIQQPPFHKAIIVIQQGQKRALKTIQDNQQQQSLPINQSVLNQEHSIIDQKCNKFQQKPLSKEKFSTILDIQHVNNFLRLQQQQNNFNGNMQLQQFKPIQNSNSSNKRKFSQYQETLNHDQQQFINIEVKPKKIPKKRIYTPIQIIQKNLPKNYCCALQTYLREQDTDILKKLIQKVVQEYQNSLTQEQQQQVKINFKDLISANDFNKHWQLIQQQCNIKSLITLFTDIQIQDINDQQQIKLKLMNKMMRIMSYKFVKQQIYSYFFNNKRLSHKPELRYVKEQFVDLIKNPNKFESHEKRFDPQLALLENQMFEQIYFNK